MQTHFRSTKGKHLYLSLQGVRSRKFVLVGSSKTHALLDQLEKVGEHKINYKNSQDMLKKIPQQNRKKKTSDEEKKKRGKAYDSSEIPPLWPLAAWD